MKLTGTEWTYIALRHDTAQIDETKRQIIMQATLMHLLDTQLKGDHSPNTHIHQYPQLINNIHTTDTDR